MKSEPHVGAARFVLSARAAIVKGRDALLLRAPEGRVFELEGDTGALAEHALGFFASAHTRDELMAEIASAAEVGFDARVVDELLDVLIGASAVVVLEPAPQERPRDGRHVVLAVSGAIQAVETPRAVMELQRLGFEVRVALTETARRFVSESALRAITHHDVPASLASADARVPVPHVELAGWADVVVVYPATATTLSRIATGDCSDLVAAIAITTRAPVLLVPSMNGAMLSAPAVARNLETLQGDGFLVMTPGAAIEVADAPAHRSAHAGRALPPHDVVAMVPAILERFAAPVESTDWDAIYARGDAPWESGALFELLGELDAMPVPSRVLDLGAGTGSLAIAIAAKGHVVVATDTSETALVRARERVGAERVLFVCDDVRATKLRTRFDLVVDRACFHTLRDADGEAYRASLRSLVTPGGRVVIVHDAEDALSTRRTRRLSPADLAVFLGLELVASVRTTLVAAEDATAWHTTLRA